MKQVCLFIIFFDIGFRVFAQMPNNATIALAQPQTYALVIGISQYAPGSNLPSLNFAHRDAKEFASFLQTRSGGSVPSENIRLLVNEDATIGAVDNALSWLKNTCKKDDLVFFYFAGHGDKESETIFNLGYLLTYNTQRPNYRNFALRIEDLNNDANTLSVTNNAKVVLITDACHSGDMASGSFHWSNLVGKDLQTVRNKEIRIASCATNQNSAENQEWGGGRGVFSWYLIRGLEGLADRDNDGRVSLKDIRQYLDSSFSKDHVIEENKIIQTPVLMGKDSFTLAIVDKDALANLNKNDLIPVVQNFFKPLPMQPLPYVLKILKLQHPEELINFFKLDSLSPENIPFEVIDQLRSHQTSKGYQDTLTLLKDILRDDKDKMALFSEKLVEAIHNRGQEIINLYLGGDEAEMERRRYYNFNSSGYEMYPKMFAVALKLTTPANGLYHKLEVNLHYFSGVVARLKIPLVKDPGPLLKTAMREQLKAFNLDSNAAYIHNELGVLFSQKNDLKSAENHFFQAAGLEPEWAMPWANLCGLYGIAKKTEAGLNAGHIADSLQPGLHLTNVHLGFVYENAGNWLYAEEAYRKAIDINSRHYLPFERLGYVYLTTTSYASADSFFYEASLRKKGYHFSGNMFKLSINDLDKEALSPFFCEPNNFDTAKIAKEDVTALFYWAMRTFWFNPGRSEQIFKKLIAQDRNDPLVYHYLGMIFYWRHQWEKAEVMFKLAFKNYLDSNAFENHVKKLTKITYPYDHECFDITYRHYYYQGIEDQYFLAHIYDSLAHYEEAEACFKSIIALNPSEITGYVKLWRLMESRGWYAEAEKVIQSYAVYNNEMVTLELNEFYRRCILQFPGDGNWPHKLGLLLYERRPALNQNPYLDSIVYFPLVNREIFIGMEELRDFAYDSTKSLQNMIFRNGDIDGILNIGNIRRHPISVPGTGEHIDLAFPEIFTPRMDAITYFILAASLLREPETVADLNFKTANLYVRAGSKKQAIPYFEKSLDMIPDNAGVRLKMIDACQALYKNRMVLENLDILYQKKELNFPHRLLFGEFNIHAGEFVKGLQVLNEARSIFPYALPEIADLNGRLNLLSGRHQEALPFYQDYLVYKKNDPFALYTVAKLYAQLNKAPEAWRSLEAALANGFNYSWVLGFDPVWKEYRKSVNWKELMGRFPGKKKYAGENP